MIWLSNSWIKTETTQEEWIFFRDLYEKLLISRACGQSRCNCTGGRKGAALRLLPLAAATCALLSNWGQILSFFKRFLPYIPNFLAPQSDAAENWILLPVRPMHQDDALSET